MEKPCYLFDKSVYMDYYELVCPCETTGKRRRKMLPISVARLLNFACHLFCQLFVWSMNTMILILPQCVSYDLFTTDSRLAERDFGKKLRLRSQEVWEMWCSVFKWIGNGWQSLNWIINNYSRAITNHGTQCCKIWCWSPI